MEKLSFVLFVCGIGAWCFAAYLMTRGVRSTPSH
jgi:hypothetical protein